VLLAWTGRAGSGVPARIDYPEGFSSAGMPSADGLRRITKEGFTAVINLAPESVSNQLAGEAQLVVELGMQYVNIPVAWDAPGKADFERFAARMQAFEKDKQKVLVHCQANMRASVFSYLYRHLKLGAPQEEARAYVERIWSPNAAWQDFIDSLLWP
jgi:protein tyrosine phosphatase (PTP) superfamily phosphohydrolase (DUF442 family)